MTDTQSRTVDISQFEISEADMQHYLDGKAELCDLLEIGPELLDQLKGRAQFFVDGGHDERALIMLEMLEELDRRDSVPTLMAIETLLKLGFSDRAEEKVNLLLERDPNNADARVARAQLELSTGRWQDAAETLRTVVDDDPEATDAATQRAMVLAQTAYERFELSR